MPVLVWTVVPGEARPLLTPSDGQDEREGQVGGPLWASRWVMLSLMPFGEGLLWVLGFFIHVTVP